MFLPAAFIKRIMLLCLLFSVVLRPALAQSPHLSGDLDGVEIKYYVPFLFADTLEVELYHYKDMTLYRFSYQYDSSVNLGTSIFEKKDTAATRENAVDTIIFDGPMKSFCSETRYHFLAFKNGSDHGYNYDRNRPEKNMRVPLDSMFKFQWARRVDLYDPFLCYTPVLVDQHANPDSGTVQQQYELWDTIQNAKMATYHLSYNSQLKDLEASLGSSFDQQAKSKLCQALIITHPAALKQCCFDVDKLETYYSLERITAPNRGEIMGYFDRFVADSGKQ